MRHAAEPVERVALLVVEPSPLGRGTLYRYLKRHGADVFLAADATEAEVLLASRRPTHLICTSAFAPLVEHWRIQYRLERVVVLSGRFVEVPKAAGIDRVLEKPLAPDCLIDALSCRRNEPALTMT